MLQIQHIMIDKDIRQKDICNITGWSRATVRAIYLTVDRLI